MVLGRTPEGLIKIKTDEEGGGLRAVNCACCGCECAVSLPQSIRTLADNATAESFSFNGVFPESENFERYSDNNWYALFFISGICEVYYNNGCLQFYFDPSGVDFAETGDPDQCAFPLGSGTVTGTFTINGITGFDYFYYTDEGQQPVAPPVLIFT